MSFAGRGNRGRWSTRPGRRGEEAKRIRRPRRPGQALRQQPSRLAGWGRMLLMRVRTWAIALILVLLLGGTAFYFLTTDRFTVHKVTVTGSRSPAVMQLIQNTGLASGNIFLLDTERLRQQIIALPNVSEVQVGRRLPDELLFEVVERQPVVAWQVKGQLYGVDSAGRLISTLRTPGKLVVVYDSEGHDLYERPIAPAGYVDPQAAILARELNWRLPSELGYNHFTFDYTRSKGLSVILPDLHLRVLFGDSNDLDTKLSTLQTVIALERQEHIPIGFIDVRFKDRPFYRLAGGKNL